MAKKSSRPAKKTAAKTPKKAEQAAEPAVIEEITPVNQPRIRRAAGAGSSAGAKPRISRAQATIEQLKDEYSYVTKDLRNVLVLAAAMFALLIALNLILPLLGI